MNLFPGIGQPGGQVRERTHHEHFVPHDQPLGHLDPEQWISGSFLKVRDDDDDDDNDEGGGCRVKGHGNVFVLSHPDHLYSCFGTPHSYHFASK